MPIYDKAPVEVTNMCKQVMNQYHGPLHDLKVTADLLMATLKAEETKPGASAVKHGGHSAAATVKINTYKLRVQGHADIEIMIDGDNWSILSDAEKWALLDHELEHIEPKCNPKGDQMFDDLGRPKLSTRLHDRQFGWFDSIARRHGRASYEIKQFEEFSTNVGDHWGYWTDEVEAKPVIQIGTNAGEPGEPGVDGISVEEMLPDGSTVESDVDELVASLENGRE